MNGLFGFEGSGVLIRFGGVYWMGCNTLSDVSGRIWGDVWE